ncbi:hypothetical protein ACFYKX_14870 [Cytobacillus sp. FJAT-54145]|uniref:DUF3953 domain-containing protein n=1 Tax=Cytobacillus spartinae TaxID=3299023 RepID=A0ABW6KCG5_9BACI
MKQIFIFAGIVGFIGFMYFLYQHQLGAIPFFLLSIFFFALARGQLSKHRGQDKKDHQKNKKI